jgi:hypothetical protein
MADIILATLRGLFVFAFIGLVATAYLLSAATVGDWLGGPNGAVAGVVTAIFGPLFLVAAYAVGSGEA